METGTVDTSRSRVILCIVFPIQTSRPSLDVNRMLRDFLHACTTSSSKLARILITSGADKSRELRRQHVLAAFEGVNDEAGINDQRRSRTWTPLHQHILNPTK